MFGSLDTSPNASSLLLLEQISKENLYNKRYFTPGKSWTFLLDLRYPECILKYVKETTKLTKKVFL